MADSPRALLPFGSVTAVESFDTVGGEALLVSGAAGHAPWGSHQTLDGVEPESGQESASDISIKALLVGVAIFGDSWEDVGVIAGVPQASASGSATRIPPPTALASSRPRVTCLDRSV